MQGLTHVRYWRAREEDHGNSHQEPHLGAGPFVARPTSAFAAPAVHAAHAVSTSRKGLLSGVGLWGAPTKDPSITAGEIRAYRAWDVNIYYTPISAGRVISDCTLSSLSAEIEWTPGKAMFGVVVDGVRHTGVHSYKTAEYCLEQTSPRSRQITEIALGTVDIWGHVMEHERGYRSAFASIVSIDCLLQSSSRLSANQGRMHIADFGTDKVDMLIHTDHPILDTLREKYGV